MPNLPEGGFYTNYDSGSNIQLGNNIIDTNNTAIDSEGENKTDNKNPKRHGRFSSFSSSIHKEKFSRKKWGSVQSRIVNPRVHFTCLEALSVVDQLLAPGTRFGLMGHSCGIYYIMHMVNQFPDRIQHGPIALLTPWVPFKECPETTSKTFKFLKHVPKGLVWAVTSSMNHIGSAFMSSSNALSGALSNKDLNGSEEESEDEDDQDIEHRASRTLRKDPRAIKRMADPFIVQFSEAFDKIIIPALVQDMNRQHSNGYNSEIQMCVTDVGFDIANIQLPEDVTISAYFGYLDTIVPIEASREMGRKCKWETHEFKHSGHGGPRMSMYALEDYIQGLQAIEASKATEKQSSEKQVF
ncbi:hypothetical protein BGZ76_002842 [Entomortierella beljakovae]|nr:hypothetical protein BGZ76_002842 [Entomortierella beljakovae]